MKQMVLFLAMVLLGGHALAAPPLRSVMPMRLADGTVTVPTDVGMSAMAVGGCCASQALLGDGRYLQHAGSPRILTILAAFQDVGFTVNDPVRAFDQYLNADTLEDLGNQNQMNIASVRRYFGSSSNGRFTPQFDVVGPVTLPHAMAYYGGKAATGSDDLFSAFCKDAMELAKGEVGDWHVYDNDQDGYVELVCIVFAGFGQNQGGADSTLWAKASYQGVEVGDGLRISRFNCSPERFHPQMPDMINGTGVFIHEMSHCMGLPDLYATRSSGYVNNQGMETWSVMDYGLYNRNGFAPCPYTAWEQEIMGWTTLTDVGMLMEEGKCRVNALLPLIEGGRAYKMANTGNDREFIVMENIQKRGLNQYANGHGLLVYHVDYPYGTVNMGDAPNNVAGHPAVAVVPAGGMLVSSYLRGEGKQYTRDEWKQSLAWAPFPGTEGVVTLNDQMALPNYCFWDGSTSKATGFTLSGISEDEATGTVSFLAAYKDPSGIKEVSGKMIDASGFVYDLQGRRVADPTNGIYIVNGKKILIR